MSVNSKGHMSFIYSRKRHRMAYSTVPYTNGRQSAIVYRVCKLALWVRHSPAEKGGLQRGDLLVGLAGREIRDINDFMFILQGAKPGEAAVAVVERDGKKVELEIVFGQRRRM